MREEMIRKLEFLFRHDSLVQYGATIELFLARLQMKHLLKGISHRDMTYNELYLVLNDEIKELRDELEKAKQTKSIEEALDIMICGLIIADKLMVGGFEE
jgi:hypothetical protein